MCTCDRRSALTILAGLSAALSSGSVADAQTSTQEVVTGELSAARRSHFAAEAERMRLKAVANGDQSFGAVVVREDSVIGWGPSRVVLDRNPRAHAERVAIMDAQLRLKVRDLDGAVLVSTSRACPMCEEAAASSGIARMYWGPDAKDAGPPGKR